MIIALLNQKGGVGKTTLALNLASAAHLAGKRTLLVDLDRQGSALDWYAARSERPESKLAGLVTVKLDRVVSARQFAELGAGYDVLVLDGPARLGELTRSAAIAADLVVIPVQPGPFDLWAGGETLASLDQADAIRAELGRPPVTRTWVVNRASTGTKLARQAPAVLATAGAVAPTVVHQRIAFASSAAIGESVLTTDPDSPAAREVLGLYHDITADQLRQAA